MERNPDLGKLRYAHASPQALGSNAATSPAEAPDTVSTPDADRARGGFRSLLRMRVVKRADGRDSDLLEMLEADTLLLREENARLRVKLEAPPDAGHVIERLRALPAPPADDSSNSGEDDSWQLLTELVVMRNSLIEICREIGQAMAGLETRLAELEIPLAGGAGDALATESLQNQTRTNGHRSNGHLKEARAQ
jgi:hypothetical protein